MMDIDQSVFLDLPIEQFRDFITKLKAEYDQAREANNDLNEKYHRQLKREQRMKEEQK